jgi:hypothetical protein
MCSTSGLGVEKRSSSLGEAKRRKLARKLDAQHCDAVALAHAGRVGLQLDLLAGDAIEEAVLLLPARDVGLEDVDVVLGEHVHDARLAPVDEVRRESKQLRERNLRLELERAERLGRPTRFEQRGETRRDVGRQRQRGALLAAAVG